MYGLAEHEILEVSTYCVMLNNYARVNSIICERARLCFVLGTSIIEFSRGIAHGSYEKICISSRPIPANQLNLPLLSPGLPGRPPKPSRYIAIPTRPPQKRQARPSRAYATHLYLLTASGWITNDSIAGRSVYASGSVCGGRG